MSGEEDNFQEIENDQIEANKEEKQLKKLKDISEEDIKIE